MADDADDHESADGWSGASGCGTAGVPGDFAGGRTGGHGGSAAFSFAYSGMDGAGFRDPRHHDADQLRRTLGIAPVYVFAGPWCGDERSGVAGDYAGASSCKTARFGSGSEFRRIQRGASRGAGLGRRNCGGRRMRHNILAKCIFVPWRDRISLSLAAAD